MRPQILSLALSLFLVQVIRSALLLSFVNSALQSHVLFYVVGSMWPELLLIGGALRWHGMPATMQQLIPALGARDPKNLAMIGMVLMVCTTALAGSVVLINGSSAMLPDAPFRGRVTVDGLLQHSDGCFEVDGAIPQLSALGAVRYSLTARVHEFFYAVPFESADWTPSRPVRAWLILSESELKTESRLSQHIAMIVPSFCIHAEAFRKAILNAEERCGAATAAGAVMLRLLDDVPRGASAFWTTQSGWIMMIYSLGWLFSLPYAARAFQTEPLTTAGAAAEEVQIRTSAAATVEGRDHGTAPTLCPVNPFQSWLQTRWGWFLVHVCGCLALLIGCSMGAPGWLPFLLMIAAPIAEFFLARWVFTHPATRTSGRFVILALVLPLSAFWGLMLIGVGTTLYQQSFSVDGAPVLNPAELQQSWSDQPIRLTGLRLREDLIGSFWAPSESARLHHMTPVVADIWNGEPIRIWVCSTDRDRTRFDGQPLDYVRRLPRTSDVRCTMAIRDAEQQHGIVADENLIVLERVFGPDERRHEASGFMGMAFFLCLFAWVFSACFWPRTLTTEVTRS